MIITLNNLMLMEKQTKLDKENKTILEFVCFQKGYKNLITIKDIPQDLFAEVEEGCQIALECKMTVWGNNSSYGASFKYKGIA